MDNTRETHLRELLAQKLASSPKTLFSPSDIEDMLEELRTDQGLPKSVTLEKFRKLAFESKALREVKLTSTYPLHTTRYHSGIFTPYELAVSLRPNSYLSHGSAAFIHGLTTQKQDFIYANQEQSSKARSDSLTQQALNRAFASKQRQSSFIITHKRTKMLLLSGKDTNRLGVGEMTGTETGRIEVTNLERTLIDIAVRPAYAGGTKNVLLGYSRAIPKISVELLSQMLDDLDYLYPYHQAIGFYLQRAGCDSEALTTLKACGLRYDFFLAHGMKRTKFDSGWRIHYPEDFAEIAGVSSTPFTPSIREQANQSIAPPDAENP